MCNTIRSFSETIADRGKQRLPAHVRPKRYFDELAPHAPVATNVPKSDARGVPKKCQTGGGVFGSTVHVGGVRLNVTSRSELHAFQAIALDPRAGFQH
jgi:hypothetical protein